MHIKFSFHKGFERMEQRWSRSPFSFFEHTDLKGNIFGEGDFYKEGGVNHLISGNFDVDGRFICFVVTSDKICIYPDKSGFVKPYINFNGKHLQVTTEPEEVYSHANKFSNSGVYCFLELGYVPAPYSLYEDWKVIPPGYFAEVSLKKKSITFKKWWKFHKINERITPKKFWSNFCSEVQSLEGYRSSDPTILLSGGIDSRLIATAVNRPKKSCYIRMNGFIPDEEDALMIKSYPEGLKGNHQEVVMNLDGAEIKQAFVESSYQAVDHAHMGRWKFNLLLNQMTKESAGGLFLNGQTSDTLLMKNITGDNFTSRLTRGLYSKHANLLDFPGFSYALNVLTRFLPRNKAVKLSQLRDGWGTPSYYSGYLLNRGFVPGKKIQRSLVDDVLDTIVVELLDTYNGEVEYIISDLLLRTFIWGADMRGIEDASKVFGIKMRFVFMQEKIMQMLLNLPYYYNPQIGEYKHFLKKICKSVVPMHKSNKNLMIQREGCFSNLEQKLSETVLGLLLRKIQKNPEYSKFQELLKSEYNCSLQGISLLSQAESFVRLQRFCTLFLFWKFLNGETPREVLEFINEIAE